VRGGVKRLEVEGRCNAKGGEICPDLTLLRASGEAALEWRRDRDTPVSAPRQATYHT
jgi:hypothetical protein